MKVRDFLKKSLIFNLVAALGISNVAVSTAYGSDTKVYAGAEGLFKEAIEIIEAGTGEFDPVLDENEDSYNSAPINLEGTFLNGVTFGNIDLSGKTYDQGIEEIRNYVSNVSNSKVTINSFDDSSVEVSLSDLGAYWNDESTVVEAFLLGKEGNAVERYKTKKDVEHDGVTYPINMEFDKSKVTEIVQAQANENNVAGVPATLSKGENGFEITPGVPGESVDIKGSVATIMSELENCDGNNMSVDLKIDVNDPQEQIEQLQKIQDVIGSYKTSYSTSSADRSGNVSNGTKLVNGTLLYPGEQFSMYETVSPFTEENGYFLAGSYSNGMVVESFGGGICQVSSTLYNAVLRAELEVVERYNHSMIVSYVDLSSDAAISGTSKDFKFVNNKSYPIYIEGYTTSDKQVVFNIYGVEDRPANREVSFESVKISETIPEGDRIIADSSLSLGTIKVQSPHTGYVGELWKIVKVDGVETERIQINKSTYHPSQRTASVGTATDNAAALSIIQAAIASGSIDYVKSVIAELNAQAAAATALPVQ